MLVIGRKKNKFVMMPVALIYVRQDASNLKNKFAMMPVAL